MPGDVFTPIYGWPYQSLVHSPDGAALGEEGFNAAEKTVSGIDARVSPASLALINARIAALEALSPYRARQTLPGVAASITFLGIPSNLRTLRVSWTARSNDAAAIVDMLLRVNNDAGVNYTIEAVQGNAAAVSAAIRSTTTAWLGHAVGAGSAAGQFAVGVTDFVGWDSPHANALGLVSVYAAAVSAGIVNASGGTYFPAGPYTRLDFLPSAGSFIAGTDVQLYGEYA